MSALENAKTYTGKNLETIFFRPMLSGPSAIIYYDQNIQFLVLHAKRHIFIVILEFIT